MELIYYSTEKNNAGKHLNSVIQHLSQEIRLENFSSTHKLSLRLRQPVYDIAVAVLLAGNRKELLDFLSIHDLLANIPLILILPDRENDTVSKGHRFHPRYLAYVDSDFSDVGLVLEKMISNIRHGKRKHYQP